MSTALEVPPNVLKLHAQRAAEIMAPNPISLRAEATIAEAMTLFAEKGIAAAPVIDSSGHPIGVVSRSDLFIHHREETRRQPDYFFNPDADATARPDAQAAALRAMTVADIMTPAVFAVGPDTHVSRVVGDMVGMHVHRLFVVADDGVLIGVITAMDVLKALQP